MLERIKRQWRDARGPGLRREFTDAASRLNGSAREGSLRASVTMSQALEHVEAGCEPLSSISNGKRHLAKALGHSLLDVLATRHRLEAAVRVREVGRLRAATKQTQQGNE
jgi:hypothetical protein